MSSLPPERIEFENQCCSGAHLEYWEGLFVEVGFGRPPALRWGTMVQFRSSWQVFVVFLPAGPRRSGGAGAMAFCHLRAVTVAPRAVIARPTTR